MTPEPPDFEKMQVADQRAETRLMYGEIALLAAVVFGAWLYQYLIA
jgi:hypothetical protein